MDEKKLVKLLEERFPTKKEFLAIEKKIDEMDFGMLSIKNRLRDISLEIFEFKKETREEFKNIEQNFKIVNERLDELKSSANVLDEILVEHPIERISRLEKHSKLPKFVPAVSAE
jgi:hypothetical protein